LNDTSLARRFEDLLPRVRQPARLIGGETGSGPGFSANSEELRVVLGFPDIYEIGVSNQAIQILYHLARQTEGVAVERTYLPWVDVIAEMRREQIPLLTIETWTPVAASDLVGFTLQHESGHTNLLEALDLAGIPLATAERGEEHPLVVGGGPACANFLPLMRFLDAVAVGDGEELFPEILRTLASAKREGAGRKEKRRRLSTLEGVFVPGISSRVERRTVARLEDADYPAACLVPSVGGVHDRAWVEVMRGCTRGCRFCQAGMWYRPVRERSPERVLAMTQAQLLSTGYQEVAFASLSTTDYSRLDSLLADTATACPEVRVSLPSLRVDSAAVRLAGLASPTGGSLTLAPEAGSQRMRDLINKNVTELDILGAAEEAFRRGKTTLKLYFLIGLPGEDDADVTAVCDLCLRVRDLGRSVLGPRSGRLQLNVSVNNFVPKPFTPFQWAGMAERGVLERRQSLLRSRLCRSGIRLTLANIEASYVEAALARGDESLGAVLEEAWRRGARFDSWTEGLRSDAWLKALAAVGTSAERLATTELDAEQPLPWEIVEATVRPSFLRAEWQKAMRAETTPDCRWCDCSDCGVCGGVVQNDLAEAGPEEPVRASASEAPAPGNESEARRWRYVATFSVDGRGRFLGHLDRTEAFRRAVRRAGGHLSLSGGMRPKAILSLALPLAVGVEGRCELAEFALAEEADEGFSARLAVALPEHVSLQKVEPYTGRRALASRVEGASYEVQVKSSAADGMSTRVLEAACASFGLSSSLVVGERRDDGGPREVDVKRYVDGVTVTQGEGGTFALAFRTRVSPAGTARPEQVIEALAAVGDLELAITSVARTQIHLAAAEG
jgi:radical SAM-linked protein